MKLLIKFPTRGRKEKFFNVLDKYYDNLDDVDNVRFVITCDNDDDTMNTKEVRALFDDYKNLEYHYGDSKSKIEAVNNDINDLDFDILLLASDDMVPQTKGYDTIIKDNMGKYYPDKDGVLWFYDGYRRDLNTLCVMGVKYYKRFNYIYHPDYNSFYCDNEFTIVANRLKRQQYIDTCIIKHLHPDITKELHDSYDETYLKNNKGGDDTIFAQRMNKNFDLKL